MVPLHRAAASDAWIRETEELAAWLIGPARLSGDAVAVTSGFAQRLTAMGIPLHRLRIGMRVDNPLLTAWGIVWAPETAAEIFTIPHAFLDTSTYIGSPSQHVMETQTWFRQRLDRLEPEDHAVLQELASAGFTDYLGVPVTFGNGIIQAAMFATRHASGFSENHIALIKDLAVPLSAALEAIAMRRSTASLLATFLGEGPAAGVQAGAIRRGDIVETEAAILLTDMRGFTPLSLTASPTHLLATLGRYFEAVVDAVRAEGGDVLKFVGDGVLSIFRVSEGGCPSACAAAVRAVSRVVAAARAEDLPPFVAALHAGSVMYGNIGSRDRLDFTVVGPAVNMVSRLEGIAKATGETVVCSETFAAVLPGTFTRTIGRFELKGLNGEHDVFAVVADQVGHP
ncbi:adenylate/guanylate cyclase domain-containing protein (plasmid) [Microvirga terrae]|uniref:Adenylate/guanylate cyclase domain-containing protein n=1 Tax=Microvirga terrae TaxID=2740529 RepID=A0ABY5S089_9HYPH|nr:adenylate/guanylate cyclase domain-containing protein [Microvirga terrae]UVF22708.1 adenylate/guanylate cyclase domain-containing protein [Microvirga terrae]